MSYSQVGFFVTVLSKDGEKKGGEEKKKEKKRRRRMKRSRDAAVMCSFVLEEEGTVKSFKIKPDTLVQVGDIVCLVQKTSGQVVSLPFAGSGEGDALIVKICAREGVLLQPGAVLFEFRWCSHSLAVHGLCTGCHQGVVSWLVEKRIFD